MTRRFHGSRHSHRQQTMCRNEECVINRGRGGESHTAPEKSIVDSPEKRKKSATVSIKQPEIHKCLYCGTVVSTACEEYFCPLCQHVIIQPSNNPRRN